MRVLLVDDHQLLREGLRSILEREAGIDRIDEAGNGRDAVRLTGELRPAVVIMDVAMQDLNGIEATRQIKSAWPETRVIALSGHQHRRYVLAVLAAGADAYVLKAGAYDELCRALRAVCAGQQYLCPEVASIVVSASLQQPPDGSAFARLAPREREVLQLIAEGSSSAEIAARLHLSLNTIDTHRRNLMRKLGLHNVADITRYAIREGLASPDA